MMNFMWSILLLSTSIWLVSNVEAKKSKKEGCISNGDINNFKADIHTEFDALKNDVSELKEDVARIAAYIGEKDHQNELKELRKDVNDMKERMMKGMEELLTCVNIGTGQVMWGDWNDWSLCDKNLCNIIHRERLCLSEGGRALDPSHCSKLAGEHIQSKQCCKELQGIDKKTFYENIYKKTDDPLPSVYVKATGSNVKVYERKKLSWVVSLKFMKTSPNGKSEHICGGVILSNIWVITAAHCICDKYTACCDEENKVICNMSKWKITAGEWRLGATSKTEQHRDVEHIVVHNQFSDELNYRMDIALIKLSSSLDFMDNPYVQPSLLPARSCRRASGGKCIETHKDWAQQVDCFTTGWGVGNKGQVQDKGHTVKVRIKDYVSQNTVIGSERIRGEKIVCLGYSGSPLMCNINTTAMEFIPPQDMVVLGLNSLIYPSGCDKQAKNYTQTDLIYHMEWISDTVMDWIPWGSWSKCSKGNKRHRLRSGFFPEYGYLQGDGPLYQNYNGDRFKIDEASCEGSTTTGSVTVAPTMASTTTVPSTTMEDPLAPYTARIGDCQGNDLDGGFNATLHECAQLCTRKGQCVGFVYNRNPIFNEECWLKQKTCLTPTITRFPNTMVYDKTLVILEQT
ncbi:unnamed protein product [Owenia fusiformis]|uniref:Uncharacterized protein n=1 Tax=Owenia fusiformis TaxID=6347 RepID=A0A8J1UJV9_OWEFU|nr:unnamed protein product [Owenia fusiformis]